MKIYTKIYSKEEFLKAYNKGKIIQFFNQDEWMQKNADVYFNDTEYRTVEFYPTPKQDDEILVWDDDETIAVKNYFVTFWGDKIYAAHDKGGTAFTWNNWKPFIKKKEPREIIANEYPDGSFSTHFFEGPIKGQVKFREVLEDE